MDSFIKTVDINRSFSSGNSSVYALKAVNISVAKGTFTILRGRSGSGKTTLLNLLGALDTPTSGEIYIADREITKTSEKGRDNLRRLTMGFVFQSVALISMMSAYENVEFGLRIAGYSAKERKSRAEECLNMVGLGRRMHHKPGELSGGEQQRVAIARAIAHKPQLVFADEPTAELDTLMGLQVVKLLKKLVDTEGITVIMTTHDPGMMEIADRVITLEDGEVVNG